MHFDVVLNAQKMLNKNNREYLFDQYMCRSLYRFYNGLSTSRDGQCARLEDMCVVALRSSVPAVRVWHAMAELGMSPILVSTLRLEHYE